ncbi:MAG: hypothetical protein H6907_05675 [Hyphomicrobiales bacterium]|nr:hypothetical protein [Hyphomicrobiales bacterium]MCP5371205.1 hypothetical protein [Hyphomicrobiales bacterium]
MRQSTLVFLALAGLLSLALFAVKYQYQDLEQELAALHRDIRDETREAHVLRAEWANLNEPARLRQLAGQYLGMEEVTPAQVVQAGDVATLVLQERPDLARKPGVGHARPAPAPAVRKPTTRAPTTQAPAAPPRMSIADIERLLSKESGR